MFKIKKYLINKYYDFIFWLEEFFEWLETKVNNHRKRIDDKYWKKYIR
jgi:hypothetical protein